MTVFVPCPFCGCENMYITHDEKPKPGCGNEIYYYVNCARCTAVVAGRNTQEAIDEWNKRHIPLEPLYYPSEQIISLTMLVKRHCDLATKYGKALQALKEVGDNFENIDSDWVKDLVNELEEVKK